MLSVLLIVARAGGLSCLLLIVVCESGRRRSHVLLIVVNASGRRHSRLLLIVVCADGQRHWCGIAVASSNCNKLLCCIWHLGHIEQFAFAKFPPRLEGLVPVISQIDTWESESGCVHVCKGINVAGKKSFFVVHILLVFKTTCSRRCGTGECKLDNF